MQPLMQSSRSVVGHAEWQIQRIKLTLSTTEEMKQDSIKSLSKLDPRPELEPIRAIMMESIRLFDIIIESLNQELKAWEDFQLLARRIQSAIQATLAAKN